MGPANRGSRQWSRIHATGRACGYETAASYASAAGPQTGSPSKVTGRPWSVPRTVTWLYVGPPSHLRGVECSITCGCVRIMRHRVTRCGMLPPVGSQLSENLFAASLPTWIVTVSRRSLALRAWSSQPVTTVASRASEAVIDRLPKSRTTAGGGSETVEEPFALWVYSGTLGQRSVRPA